MSTEPAGLCSVATANFDHRLRPQNELRALPGIYTYCCRRSQVQPRKRDHCGAAARLCRARPEPSADRDHPGTSPEDTEHGEAPRGLRDQIVGRCLRHPRRLQPGDVGALIAGDDDTAGLADLAKRRLSSNAPSTNPRRFMVWGCANTPVAG